jgi:hypothetical protein
LAGVGGHRSSQVLKRKAAPPLVLGVQEAGGMPPFNSSVASTRVRPHARPCR